jgi:hypothetical protein
MLIKGGPPAKLLRLSKNKDEVNGAEKIQFRISLMINRQDIPLRENNIKEHLRPGDAL